MPLVTQVTALATRVATEIKNVRSGMAVKADLIGGLVPVGQLPSLDLVAKLGTPLYASHRGGSLRFPEQTMAGYRQSAADGFIVECDVMPNADGVLVTNHDDTVDRTWVNTTGTVASRTTAQWREGTVQPPIAGGNIGKPTFWADVLNELGGRCVLMPEIKSPTTSWTLAQRTAFLDDILSRGLKSSVIVQSFTYSTVLEAVAKGIRGLMLGNSQTPAQLAADGVWGIGLPNTTTKTEITSYKAAGIKVLVYTIDTRAERATWIETNGADGIFSNDIWWTSKRFNVNANATDPTAAFKYDFTSGIPWPGMRGNASLAVGPDPRGEFVSGGWSLGERGRALGTWGAPIATGGIVLGYAGPRGPNVRCRSRIFYTNDFSANTRWAGIFWGNLDPEVGFSDDATQAVGGYHLLFRRSGELVLFKKVSGGAATQLVTTDTNANAPTAAGPSITTEAEVTLELEINATSVIGRVMWGGTTIRTITSADTTYRPTNGYFQISSNNATSLFRDIDIRSLP